MPDHTDSGQGRDASVTPEAIVTARKVLALRWDAEGQCGSCGWHAALGQYGVEDADLAEALGGNGILWLPCLTKDEDGSDHRGVRIRVTLEEYP